MEFGTSFSKLKIMRIAIRYSTKKCGVLVHQCLAHNNAVVSLGTNPDNREHYLNIYSHKKKCPTFILPDFCNILYNKVMIIGLQAYFNVS